MKKTVVAVFFTMLGVAHGGPMPVKEAPVIEWRIARTTVPSAGNITWKSDLPMQRIIKFENVSANDVFIATFTITSTNTACWQLNTRNAPGNILEINADDNATWYFFGAGVGDVRIIYGR